MNFAQPTAMMQRYLLDNVLLNKVHHIEALDLLALLPDQSIDAIITDLPYGTTACAWDEIIPFAPMWAGVRRVLKPRGVFVTTASQPFTSALVMSNLSWFKYAWVWEKSLVTGFVHAKNKPLKRHEDVLVFSPGTTVHEGQSQYRMKYFPQMKQGTPYSKRQRSTNTGFLHAPSQVNKDWVGTISQNDGSRYPDSVLQFDNGNNFSVHPTQKPTALYQYLIRTYTQPGEIVLDFCSGSGTTGEAARAEGRQFILGEKEAEYVAVTRDRLRMPFERRHVPMNARVDDLPLFAAVGGD